MRYFNRIKNIKINIVMKVYSRETADNIDMGLMIQKILKERKIRINDFAKTIHCSRTNVYNIFKRRSIDTERLKQIAKVLDLDVSDFIILEKRDLNKCVVIMEIEGKDLRHLLNTYDSTYIKHWTIK